MYDYKIGEHPLCSTYELARISTHCSQIN